MNPDIQPLEPIDPPDNTGGGRSSVDNDADQESSEVESRRLAIDPPDNTGGG